MIAAPLDDEYPKWLASVLTAEASSIDPSVHVMTPKSVHVCDLHVLYLPVADIRSSMSSTGR